jgi:hypothetical protein
MEVRPLKATAHKRPLKAASKSPVLQQQGDAHTHTPSQYQESAKLTGARHELCTWGEPARPGVGSLSRKRSTPSTLNQTGRDTSVCCEQALKSVGERNTRETSENRKETHNGGGAVCYGAEKF